MRPVLAGSTSFAVSSTETNVGFWSSIALTCVLPGGSTRLYSVPTRVLNAILLSTVAVSASWTSAPDIATLFAGSVRPERNGAQVFITVVTRSLPNPPTRARSDASGGTSGGPHPGSCTSGNENGMPARRATSAGQAACWPAAKIPADCTPMLLLVPSATNRANTCGIVSGVVALGDPGAAARGATGSAHAANANDVPRTTRET